MLARIRSTELHGATMTHTTRFIKEHSTDLDNLREHDHLWCS
jgi:hypothetical protein